MIVGIILALFILFSVDLVDLEDDATWVKIVGLGGVLLIAVFKMAIAFFIGLVVGTIIKMAICHFYKMMKERINEGY